MRLDRFFEARFPGLSFSHIQRIIRKGEVRVNGKRAQPKDRLAAGPGGPHSAAQDRAAEAARRRARERPEGPRLPQVDHAATRTTTCWCSTSRWGLRCRAAPAPTRHLDGMLGAHDAARTASGRGWCTGSTRTPPAACWSPRRALPRRRWRRPSARARRARSTGRWSPACRSRSRAASRPSSPRRSARTRASCAIAKHGEEGASHAVTYYAVVETAAQKLAWLSLKPVTGRTHQLRAHMAHIGHPIVGDPKYFNNENWELPGGMQNKLHLLARRIAVPHPRGGAIDVTAPLPPHMQQILEPARLRRQALRSDRGRAGGIGQWARPGVAIERDAERSMPMHAPMLESLLVALAVRSAAGALDAASARPRSSRGQATIAPASAASWRRSSCRRPRRHADHHAGLPARRRTMAATEAERRAARRPARRIPRGSSTYIPPANRVARFATVRRPRRSTAADAGAVQAAADQRLQRPGATTASIPTR